MPVFQVCRVSVLRWHTQTTGRKLGSRPSARAGNREEIKVTRTGDAIDVLFVIGAAIQGGWSWSEKRGKAN